jgi:hypothetical protein
MTNFPMSAGKNGWPTSTIAPDAPQTEDEQAALIDTIEEWKTQRYQELIGVRLCGMPGLGLRVVLHCMQL